MMAQRCLAFVATFSSILVFPDAVELRETARAHETSLEAEWSGDLQVQPTKVVEYKSPLERVLGLLRKMKAELEHEASHEAEMYDKMVCWCETNHKEKEKAIKDADAKDKQLMSEIEARSSRSGALATHIKATKEEIASLTEALSKATSIREKEAAEYQAETKLLTQSITNVANAQVVLKKHQSFLQLNAPLMMGMKTLLRDLATKHILYCDKDASQRSSARVRTALISVESETERASVHATQRMNRELIKALNVQEAGADTIDVKYAEKLVSRAAKPAPAISFLQLDKPASYSPGSAPIDSMLKELQEDFSTALENAGKDEKKAIKGFQELSAAKNGQIDASKEKLDDLEEENARNGGALTDAKEDLEMTRDQRAADVKFLSNLKDTCRNLNKEWEGRSKARSDEIQAVSSALSIITNDETFNMIRGATKFVQLSARSRKGSDILRDEAADSLRGGLNNMLFGGTDDLLSEWEGRHSASASDSLSRSQRQLAALTVSVRLDKFEKVKASMDKLVKELKEQQQEEVEFKAKCIKDFDFNAKSVFKKETLKEDLEGAIKSLAEKLSTLDSEIADAKKQIADTETEVKKASQNREAENYEFQTTVADQRATQDILKKALGKLKAVKDTKAFVQVDSESDETSDETQPSFAPRKKNAAMAPAIAMIENIIGDSAKLEADCVAGEKSAQASYESFVADSNGLISKLSKLVVEKTKSIADAKTKSAIANGDLESTEGELESLAKVKADLHASCDFVMKNFQIRQKARLSEIEAIQQAEAVLSGAKLS